MQQDFATIKSIFEGVKKSQFWGIFWTFQNFRAFSTKNSGSWMSHQYTKMKPMLLYTVFQIINKISFYRINRKVLDRI